MTDNVIGTVNGVELQLIPWVDFKQMPTSQQESLLNSIKKTFKVGNATIAKNYFNIPDKPFYKYLKEKKLSIINSQCTTADNQAASNKAVFVATINALKQAGSHANAANTAETENMEEAARVACIHERVPQNDVRKEEEVKNEDETQTPELSKIDSDLYGKWLTKEWQDFNALSKPDAILFIKRALKTKQYRSLYQVASRLLNTSYGDLYAYLEANGVLNTLFYDPTVKKTGSKLPYYLPEDIPEIRLYSWSEFTSLPNEQCIEYMMHIYNEFRLSVYAVREYLFASVPQTAVYRYFNDIDLPCMAKYTFNNQARQQNKKFFTLAVEKEQKREKEFHFYTWDHFEHMPNDVRAEFVNKIIDTYNVSVNGVGEAVFGIHPERLSRTAKYWGLLPLLRTPEIDPAKLRQNIDRLKQDVDEYRATGKMPKIQWKQPVIVDDNLVPIVPEAADTDTEEKPADNVIFTYAMNNKTHSRNLEMEKKWFLITAEQFKDDKFINNDERVDLINTWREMIPVGIDTISRVVFSMPDKALRKYLNNLPNSSKIKKLTVSSDEALNNVALFEETVGLNRKLHGWSHPLPPTNDQAESAQEIVSISTIQPEFIPLRDQNGFYNILDCASFKRLELADQIDYINFFRKTFDVGMETISQVVLKASRTYLNGYMKNSIKNNVFVPLTDADKKKCKKRLQEAVANWDDWLLENFGDPAESKKEMQTVRTNKNHAETDEMPFAISETPFQTESVNTAAPETGIIEDLFTQNGVNESAKPMVKQAESDDAIPAAFDIDDGEEDSNTSPIAVMTSDQLLTAIEKAKEDVLAAQTKYSDSMGRYADAEAKYQEARNDMEQAKVDLDDATNVLADLKKRQREMEKKHESNKILLAAMTNSGKSFDEIMAFLAS